MESNIKFQTSSSCYEHIGGNNFKLKTMEKKQTAVDYLVQELIKQGFFKRLPVIAIQQAAQMEKEQMWDYITKKYCIGDKSLEFHKLEFEQYYNETFGGETE